MSLLRKRNFIPSGTRLQVQPQLMGKAKIRSYLGETVLLVERNRFAEALARTNITEAPNNMASSRGHLVSSYLLSNSALSLDEEVKVLTEQDAKYAGFNLFLLAPLAYGGKKPLKFAASFVTNHGAGGLLESRPLTSEERSIGGMTNGIDGKDGQNWPKLQHGIQSLSACLAALPKDITEADLTTRLFELLTWKSAEPLRERSDLRKTIHIEPLHVPLGNGAPDFYATRLSTVILIRRDGQVVFIERDIWGLDEDGKAVKRAPTSERVHRFQLQLPIT
ncbi:hypothetical protein HWV62_43912 [Athelia sp. TMB]|nr:hypothetical protein HWV62_43912 [Athelia sp. TMB]